MIGPYSYFLWLSSCALLTWLREHLYRTVPGSYSGAIGRGRALDNIKLPTGQSVPQEDAYIGRQTMSANNPPALSLGNSTSNLTGSWVPPLSTRGRYIIDANEQRFKLRGGNWHGASGTYLGRGDINNNENHHAGEKAYQTPLCLDRVAIDDIVESFLQLGINAVRLPFSNEMIETTAQNTIPDAALAANPQFRGMTPLEIYDACVEALTSRGIAVILNNHTVKSLWCCGVDVNARWNGAQSTEAWIQDWLFMVRRYKDNARVVGAELYNEPRRDFLSDPVWGSGGITDWWQASFEAGTRIHREANADILIIVEGINYVGIPTRFTTHYRPELQPVANLSHAFPSPDKLIYSSHFYAYTGPNATGGSDIGGTDDALYRDLEPSVLSNTLDTLAFYVATNLSHVQKHYTSPVWISEFGSGGRSDTLAADRSWWNRFCALLRQHDADYAIWPLVGWQTNGQGDGYALNEWDANGRLLSITDPGDWRLDAFAALQNDTNLGMQGEVPLVPQWTMLYPQLGSAQQSNVLAQSGGGVNGLQTGDRKASCPDGLRLAALSHQRDPSALCTDATFGRGLWNGSASTNNLEIVTTEVHVQKDQDWAKGFTKLQCPTRSFLVGYSYTDDTSISAVCAPVADANANLPAHNRTVWFDKNVNIDANQDHGNFATPGHTFGACRDDELATGYAFSLRDNGGWPAALLCQTNNIADHANAALQLHQPPSATLLLFLIALLCTVMKS